VVASKRKYNQWATHHRENEISAASKDSVIEIMMAAALDYGENVAAPSAGSQQWLAKQSASSLISMKSDASSSGRHQ
jgi:hypothetical protein